MLSIAEATHRARKYVEQQEHAVGLRLRLLEDRTVEQEFGWAFFYNADFDNADFEQCDFHAIESDQTRSRPNQVLLLGNDPFIIDRRDGSLHLAGSAKPIEYYLDNYRRTGTPHVSGEQ